MFLAATALAAPRIQVHGHRGARAAMPENSLSAFQYAIEQGVDVLEMDMAVTKDNVVVLSHDSEMNPAFCSGPAGSPKAIREMTLEELRKWDCGAKVNPEFPKQKAIAGTRVPTLDEVFTATKKAKVEYNIETKISRNKPELAPSPEEFVRLFLNLVKKHHLEGRVILQSFDFRTLVAMRQLEPKIRLSALMPESALGAFKDWVGLCKDAANAEIISPHYRVTTKGRVESAHRAGLKVIPWTANDPDQWEKLADYGVDAIITDDPAALIGWLKTKGLR